MRSVRARALSVRRPAAPRHRLDSHPTHARTRPTRARDTTRAHCGMRSIHSSIHPVFRLSDCFTQSWNCTRVRGFKSKKESRSGRESYYYHMIHCLYIRRGTQDDRPTGGKTRRRSTYDDVRRRRETTTRDDDDARRRTKEGTKEGMVVKFSKQTTVSTITTMTIPAADSIPPTNTIFRHLDLPGSGFERRLHPAVPTDLMVPTVPTDPKARFPTGL